MKTYNVFRLVVVTLVLSGAGMVAQTPAPTPAGVPAGATGKCNDGSYTTAAKKWQACGGHKGVGSWFADGAAGSQKPASASPQTAASAAQTPAAGTAMKAAPAASSTAKSSAGKAARVAAPGGGPGLVWVNTESKIYHCPGTSDYGTTKAGKYMSEADAKAAGARPNRNVACTK